MDVLHAQKRQPGPTVRVLVHMAQPFCISQQLLHFSPPRKGRSTWHRPFCYSPKQLSKISRWRRCDCEPLRPCCYLNLLSCCGAHKRGSLKAHRLSFAEGRSDLQAALGRNRLIANFEVVATLVEERDEVRIRPPSATDNASRRALLAAHALLTLWRAILGLKQPFSLYPFVNRRRNERDQKKSASIEIIIQREKKFLRSSCY